MNITVIYGSVRPNRQGIRVARYLVKQLQQRDHAVALIDPLEQPLPLLDKMYKQYEAGKAPEVLEKLAETLRNSDAFVLVSGEYNHSVPPAMKNLLDHFQKEYFWKPSAIACYSAGSFGGVRAAVHLRVICGELGMPSIPSLFPVPKVQEAFDELGEPHDERWHKRAGRFMDELEWYARALKRQRAEGTPY